MKDFKYGKRKLTAALLCLVMLLGSLAGTAFAEELQPEYQDLDSSDPVFFDQRNPVVASYLEEVKYDVDNPYHTLASTYKQNAIDQGLGWVDPGRYSIFAEQAGIFRLKSKITAKEIQMSQTVVPGQEIVFPSMIPGYSYYWSITTEEGNVPQHGIVNPYGSLRTIPLQGVYNVRDLGGWPTKYGSIRYGLLFRGSALEYHEYQLATAADLEELARLNIRLEVDLRGEDEAWGHDAIMADSPHNSIIPGASYVRTPIVGYYAGVSQDYTSYQLTVCALEQIIESVVQGRPVFFHCAAGADRTGTIAVLLEGLLGVSRSDIDKDYELTSFGSVDAARSRASDEYISMIYAISTVGGDTFEEQCINWFLNAGFDAGTLNMFREIMTIGKPEQIQPLSFNVIEDYAA